LCGSHKAVAGPKDFVDARNRFGSAGEGGDGLRTADARDFAHTEDASRRKQLMVRSRTDNHDLLCASNLSRHRRHYQRRKQSSLAAWNIAADRFNGPDPLSDVHTWFHFHRPVSRQLFLSHLSDIGYCVFHGTQEICADTFLGFFDLML